MTSLSPLDIIIRQEAPEDNDAVEALGAAAFGPGRFSRAAFRLREGVESDPQLCFVAFLRGELVGSVKQTLIDLGGKQALVLGPLMVDPSQRKLGIGRDLMNRALHAAHEKGHRFVILVGDYAYYKGFGFYQVEPGRITFPGPADPARILAFELEKGAAADYRGQAKRWFAN